MNKIIFYYRNFWDYKIIDVEELIKYIRGGGRL